MYRVIVIDDEVNILAALRRSLLSIDATLLDGEALTIETFTSPEAALERCEEAEFDLVLTDYRMPTMDGVEFLIRLAAIQPEIPRVIISGYADREAIICAINEASLTRFIEKPWDDEGLHQSVIAILTRSLGSGSRLQASNSHRFSLEAKLEKDCPGILSVWTDEDGGIRIADFDM